MIKSMAKGCAVIVIAESFVPNDYIIEMARKYGVTLISTNYNTMKIIQMIYRSIPIELIMTPASAITSFNRGEFLEDVEREMLKSRIGKRENRWFRGTLSYFKSREEKVYFGGS